MEDKEFGVDNSKLTGGELDADLGGEM